MKLKGCGFGSLCGNGICAEKREGKAMDGVHENWNCEEREKERERERDLKVAV